MGCRLWYIPCYCFRFSPFSSGIHAFPGHRAFPISHTDLNADKSSPFFPFLPSGGFVRRVSRGIESDDVMNFLAFAFLFLVLLIIDVVVGAALPVYSG